MRFDTARRLLRASLTFCLAVSASPHLADAQAVYGNFADRNGWRMSCSLQEVAVTGKSGMYPTGEFEVSWNRKTHRATLLWPNGHGKELHEIPNHNAQNHQYLVHFWMAPSTRKFTTGKAKTPDFVDIGTALFSLRTSGAAAFTRHGVDYGEMRAATVQGHCDIDGMSKDVN